jgi:hypothetical protein
MSTAAERKAKIEKLKKDRALKEQERMQREAETKKTTESALGTNDII